MSSLTSTFTAVRAAPAKVATTWSEICELAAGLVQDHPADPLDFDLVVVPAPAHRRSFSQYLANRGAGPQLSAGLEFVVMSRLGHRVAAPFVDDGSLPVDGWRPGGLEFGVLEVLADPARQAALAPLQAHLGTPADRPGRMQATARRVAGLFRRYARQHPAMVAAWASGDDEGPDRQPLADRDRWQPALWRGLEELLGPDPARRREQLLGLLGDRGVPGLPKRVVVLQLDDPPAEDQRLLGGLAQHHEVHVIALSGVPLEQPPAPSLLPGDVVPNGSTFLRHHASRPGLLSQLPPRTSTTLLSQVQDEISHDRAPQLRSAADGSLQIHACHGPNRQVEVLRDVLCGLFSDDRTLQPRDVVVLCPGLLEYAPLIWAAFCLDASADTGFHPGHRLRVQLAAPLVGGQNPVLAVLERCFELHSGRATSSDLLDLCQLPPIAQRFGFAADDLERLRDLVATAEIRWGVDADQRRRNGLPIAQSTWLAGVQRMLVSLALADQPPVSMGTLTPVPRLQGPDAHLVGQLAELVSRIRKIGRDLGESAPAQVWVARLREAIELLVEVPHEDQWQLAHALSELADLDEQAAGRSVPLAAGDVANWLADRQQAPRRRPNYGNGSLLFTSLDDLACVEARVVCVLGLDDARFPGAPGIDGDDLLARPGNGFAGHWTDQPRRVRRQRLLDALLAARDKFIVITQGADEATGQQRPVPICVAELIEACAVSGAPGQWRGGAGPDALVSWHPLHPHGWSDFVTVANQRPASFDRQGLEGAVALAESSARHPIPPWQLQHQTTVPPEVDIDELIGFFTNPARDLLRRATGTTRSSFSRELEAGLPLDQSAKATWPVGKTLFEALLAGHDPNAARTSAWLGGRVLPGRLGQAVIDDQFAVAQQVASAVRTARSGPLELLDCDVEVGERRVRGRVGLHNRRVVVHRFGHPKPDDALACWLRLLLLAASPAHFPAVQEGLLVGKRCHRLAVPEPQLASLLLGQLIQLRESGLRQVVPLPLRTAASFVDLSSWDTGEPLQRASRAFAKEDANWSYFFGNFDELLEPSLERFDPVAAGPPPSSRFEALAHWLLAPIVARLTPWRQARSGHDG